MLSTALHPRAGHSCTSLKFFVHYVTVHQQIFLQN